MEPPGALRGLPLWASHAALTLSLQGLLEGGGITICGLFDGERLQMRLLGKLMG